MISSKHLLNNFAHSTQQTEKKDNCNYNSASGDVNHLEPNNDNDIVDFEKVRTGKIYKNRNFFHANGETALEDQTASARRKLIEQKVKQLENIYRSTAKENFLSETVKKTLQKIGERLLEKSELYGVGAILREVSKTVFSRWVVEPEFQQNEPFLLLWNTMEEARTGNMLKSQYPGAKDYLRAAYYDDFFNDQIIQEEQDKIIDIIQKKLGNISREEAKKLAEQSGFVKPLPKHIQYVKAVLYEYFKGKEIDWSSPIERPTWLKDKDVTDALNKTKKDYREIFKLKKNLFGLHSLSEKEGVEYAEKAYGDVRDKLWPVYKELVEKDLGKLQQETEAGRNQQGKQGGDGQQGGNNAGGKPVESGNSDNDKISKEILDEIDKQLSGKLETIDEAQRRGGDGKDNKQGQDGTGDKADGTDGKDAGKDTQKPGKGNDGKGGSDGVNKGDGKNGKDDNGQGADQTDGKESNQSGNSQGKSGGNGRSVTPVDDIPLEELLRRKRLADEESSKNRTQYQQYLSEVFDQTQELAGIVNNVFEKNTKPRYLRGQKRPGVVDMPAVVQAAARAAKGEVVTNPPIWKKREDPVKRDHAVVFVIDHSGSMQGEKIKEALKAWIMSAEALEQVHVPWSLIVFSDDHKIVKEFGDQWDDQAREKALSGIESYAMNGTNDAAAIKPAFDMIKQRDCTGTRLILVITDGRGDEKKVRELVKEADNENVIIMAIAIDEAMEYVKEVYIHNACAKNIESLPSVLGSAISERFQLSYK